MTSSTLPESKDRNYADYVDAIRREGYLKSLKQAGLGSDRLGDRIGKGPVDADLVKKSKPVPDPAQ